MPSFIARRMPSFKNPNAAISRIAIDKARVNSVASYNESKHHLSERQQCIPYPAYRERHYR